MPRPLGARPPGPPPPPRVKNPGPATKPISVTVKSAITGDDVASLRLPLQSRIVDLKVALERPSGVPARYQQLLHHSSARELQDRETLESADLDLKPGFVMLVRKEPTESLQLACKNGDHLLVVYLTQTKANVNEVCNRFGTCSLHIAARRGRQDVVDTLLSWRADLHIQDVRGCTALHLAASDGVARSLLDAAADSSCFDGAGRTASTSLLPLFASSGDKAMIQHLLCKRALANAPYKTRPVSSEALARRIDGLHDGMLIRVDGSPALHCALQNVNEEDVQMDVVALLASVTDLTTQDKHGQTPLHLACSNGLTRACIAILSESRDPLLLARDRLKLQQSQWLLKGVWSALLREIRLQKTVGASASEITRRCLHAKDRHGNRPLHEASCGGHDAIVGLLLAARTDIHARNCRRESALWAAGVNSRTSTCKLLLDAGADVHERSKHGDGLLHRAAWGGPLELSELLIKARADTAATNRDGNTPLQVATSYGHSSIAAKNLALGVYGWIDTSATG